MIKEVEKTAKRAATFDDRAKVYGDALSKLSSVTNAGFWARVGDATTLAINLGMAQTGGWEADKAVNTALKSFQQIEKGAIAELERKV
ncbi:MAG: hypothetical protein R3F34_13815 [Planctomycetota bacterium]